MLLFGIFLYYYFDVRARMINFVPFFSCSFNHLTLSHDFRPEVRLQADGRSA